MQAAALRSHPHVVVAGTRRHLSSSSKKNDHASLKKTSPPLRSAHRSHRRVPTNAASSSVVAAASSSSSSSSSSSEGVKVVGMGSAGVDYLASIASFPEPDAKLRTDALEIQGGGNAGNALTAMSRLGVNPSILTKLSDDGAGKAIMDEFAADGVDTSAVVIEAGKSSPFTYIIVDRAGSTRTCIHTPDGGSKHFPPPCIRDEGVYFLLSVVQYFSQSLNNLICEWREERTKERKNPLAPGPEFTVEEMPHDAIVSMLEGASLLYFDGRLTEVALEVAAVAQDMGIPMLVEGERLRDNLDKLLLMGDYVVTSTGYPKDATGESALETAMVKMAASLPRAKALITTLGSRGAVMLERVDDWGGEGGKNEGAEGEDQKMETLAELLARLEKDAAAAAAAAAGDKKDEVVPVPGAPVTSSTVYLTDAGEDDAASLGPVRVTFAPASAMSKEDVADTTGAGDSFIGSVCYGVATGMALPAAMRLGAYVAGRKCTQLGARPGLPSRDTIPSELLDVA